MKPSLLVFIVGPTATGKSELALRAAREFGGEVLNTDSVQIYESVDIGTAKPSREEMALVPHHLYGVIPEGEVSTAGDFRRQALQQIQTCAAKNVDVLFAVGGSGFYVQALENGMVPVPEISAEIKSSVDADVRTLGAQTLYRELERRDPDCALGISPNDSYRIQRAIEILRQIQSKNPSASLTEIRRRFVTDLETRPFSVLKIGLLRPRPLIRQSVEKRTSEMFSRGLIEEVEALRARGLSTWAPMLSVGYKETQAFLEGRLSRDELEPSVVTSTMQLVKRQTTWFRRDDKTKWFDPGDGWEAPLKVIAAAVENHRSS